MYSRVITYFKDLGDQIGAEFYLAGGAVRDMVGNLGDPNDFDMIARLLTMDELVEALKPHGRVDVIGNTFEVVEFMPHDKTLGRFEIAIPRTEVSTGPGTGDFIPTHDPFLPIEEDLLRRDFTANSMAINVHTQEFHDPTNGKADLEARLLRSVFSRTIEEDALRIVRTFRFISKLGFDVAESTTEEIKTNLHLLSEVHKERFQKELLELVVGPYVDKAIRYAHEIGALEHFLPELEACFGCTQNKWHSFDVAEHSLRVLKNCPSKDPYVKLAALFHDLGKAVVRWVDLDVDPSGNPHFYQHEDVPGSRPHEDVSAELAYAIMKRFKFSSQHCDRVARLCGEHMFSQNPKLGRKAARKFLARLEHIPGGLRENVEALFDIRVGDCKGGKNYAEGSMEALDLEAALAMNERFKGIVLREIESKSAFTVRQLAINGHDLMGLGLVGPEIGRMQKALLSLVIDIPEWNTREVLLSKAKELMSLTELMKLGEEMGLYGD